MSNNRKKLIEELTIRKCYSCCEIQLARRHMCSQRNNWKYKRNSSNNKLIVISCWCSRSMRISIIRIKSSIRSSREDNGISKINRRLNSSNTCSNKSSIICNSNSKIMTNTINSLRMVHNIRDRQQSSIITRENSNNYNKKKIRRNCMMMRVVKMILRGLLSKALIHRITSVDSWTHQRIRSHINRSIPLKSTQAILSSWHNNSSSS